MASRNNYSSPRTRGYFRDGAAGLSLQRLFPAHAGVFPGLASCWAAGWPLPRARGGISMSVTGRLACILSSPRTRGYFRFRQALRASRSLFPAHAGVFPEKFHYTTEHGALPRARGGISGFGIMLGGGLASSPRTRGYFHVGHGALGLHPLFPAHAGVFPLVMSERTG